MGEAKIVLAITLGVNYSANAYIFKHGKTEDRNKVFNVPFNNPITDELVNNTPTVALFNDQNTFDSYGFEALHKYIHHENMSEYLIFREFIWDLFCADNLNNDEQVHVDHCRRLAFFVKYIKGKVNNKLFFLLLNI